MRCKAVAAVLCLLLAVPFLARGTAPATAAAAMRLPAAGPGVERLYAEAERAVERYEQVERALGRKRAELRELRVATVGERRRLRLLRDRVGAMARTEYRNAGLSPSARLLLSGSPDRLLEDVTLVRQGEHAEAALLHAHRAAQRRLAADRAAVAAALEALDRQARWQAALRRSIQEKLLRAGAGLAARYLALLGGDVPARCPHTDPDPDADPAAARRGVPLWVSPVAHYSLSAGFDDAGSHWAHRHTGQDFAVPSGTPVRAVGDGTVVAAGCGDGFGNQIVVRHDDGYCTHYAHLSVIETAPGRRVRAGQRIGLSGSSGNSTGPHLHFEVRVTPQMGSAVPPLPWLARHGVRVAGPDG
ncbi:peptidoglycan DD-metalloendopeptidase family protein [Streptomyces sp. NPDC058691]|uniref:peptidoglycan DD-metalloendopeptidase family protein n=1 Tax=Streptomyces sp. NPDC058691 TaxID=3346601 RepID=UPI00364D3E70